MTAFYKKKKKKRFPDVMPHQDPVCSIRIMTRFLEDVYLRKHLVKAIIRLISPVKKKYLKSGKVKQRSADIFISLL